MAALIGGAIVSLVVAYLLRRKDSDTTVHEAVSSHL